MRGALSRWTLGHIPVLVEGKSDRKVLVDMSELLRKQGKESLSNIIEPLPGGGSAMADTAKALRAMNIRFIALVDGDRQGELTKQKLMREVGQPEASIISLTDVVDSVTDPKIEDVFSNDIKATEVWVNEGLGGVLRDLSTGKSQLDKQTEECLGWLFQMLNEAAFLQR